MTTDLISTNGQQSADRLPALIDRARMRLAEARSSAEVLEAKHLADAALHYARVSGAANEAHADCMRIIARVEIRYSREYEKARDAGEVAGDGRPKTVRGSDGFRPTSVELGVPRQRLDEWRDLAAAGEDAVDAAIDEAAEDARQRGRTVTKTAVREKVRAKHGSSRRGSMHSPIVERPPELTTFCILLTNMDELALEIGDPLLFLGVAETLGVDLSERKIRRVIEFLDGLLPDGDEADPAAPAEVEAVA